MEDKQLLRFTNDEIKGILPHRYPFLLVDSVTECEPGKYAKGVKCVSAGEMYFLGHFPGKSVMPGVLILEALAQTGAVAVLTEPGNAGKLALFGGVKNARFRRQVVPGDVLELECTITRRRGAMGVGEGRATVGGQLACTAEITFVITEEP